jgi:hypothetical protein
MGSLLLMIDTVWRLIRDVGGTQRGGLILLMLITGLIGFSLLRMNQQR